MTQMFRYPTFLESISTIMVMVIVVVIGFIFFNIPIQILLLISSAYAAFIAYRVGLRWKDLEEGITKRLSTAMPAIFIILAVGIIVGSWMFSGTVPALIYYGLKFLNPSLLLVSAFIISTITSVATGTAWGSASTAGIALISIASQLGVPSGMAAGAIIAGAVFGDKMSPLSDTTNLAALVTKVNIFAHIKSMMWTTIPASMIGLIVWFFAGLHFKGQANSKQIQKLLKELMTIYNINFVVWLPLIVIIICLIFRISTVPSMLISSLSAIIIGTFNNHFNIVDGFKATFDGFNHTMVHQPHLSKNVTTLIEQGGMMSMTQIIATIFCGYAFAGIVEKAGCLDVILETVSKGVKSVGTLILITVVCCLMLVFAAGVASIVIIMVGVLMKEMFEKMNISKSVLSRTLEDSSTMVLPLIPWGTSGIYYSQQLNVFVNQYLIWTIPCYLCALITIVYGFTGIGIKKLSKD
ncbi:Na+/H+ antiporter NhaC [Staphylococcus saccharolyticus]|uniref:Na+/H+ antiporter NhaC n=1 Tax=Staphylococcus saccharolyticus TaxID=33028 RepID=A0A380H2G1_9STAP|nr:Na+/H+ antiporter NhaC [Staphylococcus saccharolyticus]MBL7564857.1 Na+/H+ antiporter NhaC [Staphylococcus saccharolyticus]MBL7570879.1 Na+/H+ antiporter NhaC [Staphylococcus saccharolyticus]QQB98740.1 Na+/H+ antiporter NhaC [Staphylococcus saccharolyticus]QRJ67045.1 Na+/H+ antiporter NhaC [Staphylococcus saccharolyticus]RTX96988.1 Na+/H+ antiporter NhaC [Staphylococcus saccharolyticus]